MSPERFPRQRSFAVNVKGTENLVHGAQAASVKRFVYTASNSVVMGGLRMSGGDETLRYTERFNDLYTETKVVAERFVLSQNGVSGMLTYSIRPPASGAAAIRRCSARCSRACSPVISRCSSAARTSSWITPTYTT